MHGIKTQEMKKIQKVLRDLRIYLFGFPFGPIQKKWLQNLEKHPERQATGMLGARIAGSYQACCLGELGLIAGLLIFDEEGSLRENSLAGNGTVLTRYYSHLGLRSAGGECLDDRFQSLASMNDSGKTWPEIAKHVRKYGKYYFTKSV